MWKKEVGGADPWLASLENEEDMEARIGEAALAQRKRWVWGRDLVVFDWLHACTYTGLSLLLLFHCGRWDDWGLMDVHAMRHNTQKRTLHSTHTYVHNAHTL